MPELPAYPCFTEEQTKAQGDACPATQLETETGLELRVLPPALALCEAGFPVMFEGHNALRKLLGWVRIF